MNYLVVGLGNIGAEYASTRHNMGFNTINKIAKEYKKKKKKNKFQGIYESGIIENQKVIKIEKRD